MRVAFVVRLEQVLHSLSMTIDILKNHCWSRDSTPRWYRNNTARGHHLRQVINEHRSEYVVGPIGGFRAHV